MAEVEPKIVADDLLRDLKIARRERSLKHMVQDHLPISMDIFMGQIRLRTYNAAESTFRSEQIEPADAVRFLAPPETEPQMIQAVGAELAKVIAIDMAGDMAA